MSKSLITNIRTFLGDERGDFSVKGIAITIGVIVVVGAVVLWLTGDGGIQSMIEDLWEALGGWMEETIGLGW